MSRPSFAARIGVVILLVFATTALAGTLLKPAVDALIGVSDTIAHHTRFDPETGTYDFGRVFRRVFMLAALVVVVSSRKWLGRVEMLGTGRADARWRLLGTGFAAGVVSWLAFAACLVVAGRRGIAVDLSQGFLGDVAVALIASLVVGLIEEWALRGYLLGGLRREWPALPAVLAASALYSVLHFLKTPVQVERGFDPLVGVTTLIEHFRALGAPGVPAGFVGLLLVGVVLSYAYLWTRSLPFAIGLHAGWVFLMQTEGHFVDGPTGQGAMYGRGGVLAGWFGWGFLLAMLPLLYAGARALRPRAGR